MDSVAHNVDFGVVDTVVNTVVDDSDVGNCVEIVCIVVDSVLFVIVVRCGEVAIDDEVGVMLVTADVLVTSVGVTKVTVVVVVVGIEVDEIAVDQFSVVVETLVMLL